MASRADSWRVEGGLASPLRFDTAVSPGARATQETVNERTPREQRAPSPSRPASAALGVVELDARPRGLRAGDVVAGKYRLEQVLGHGGMGEVWRARHEALGTSVAMKFLDAPPTDEPDRVAQALERFRFEAQISARLGARTRHIVAVHDAGAHEGVPYLAMELVEGTTLADEIDRTGPLAPRVVALVLDQVGDALGVAHELGVVHRDLKPTNLMIVHGAEPVVKVADFGVAKALRSDVALDRPRETTQGLLVGSPAYMSPEQLRADGRLDARSDVWSLGVVAYEALTGALPFEGSTIPELMMAIGADRPEPPSKLRPGLPRALDAWFERALAKRPDDRFGSVAEMAAAFRRALERSSRPPRWLAGAVLVGLAVLAGLAVMARRGEQAPEHAAPAVPVASVAAAVVAPPPSSPVAPASPTGAPELAAPAPLRASPPAPRHAVPVIAAPPAAPSASPATTASPPPPAAAETPPPPAPRPRKEIDPSEIQ
jgi:serine/threonine-protein kinase